MRKLDFMIILACLSLSTTCSETPINKFFMIKLSFFLSLGQTAAINKAYIETINFNTFNYLKPLHIFES